jgi:MraZ protein
VFIGSYDHSLDPKGRVILPRKFRDELGQDVVFTRGLAGERCLYVFPLAEFEAFAAKLRDLPLTGGRNRDFTRVFVANARQEAADSQGRVVIPQVLREYANLTKDVVVVGQLNRIELWDKAEWERYLESTQETYADEANIAHLQDLGI